MFGSKKKSTISFIVHTVLMPIEKNYDVYDNIIVLL